MNKNCYNCNNWYMINEEVYYVESTCLINNTEHKDLFVDKIDLDFKLLHNCENGVLYKKCIKIIANKFGLCENTNTLILSDYKNVFGPFLSNRFMTHEHFRCNLFIKRSKNSVNINSFI